MRHKLRYCVSCLSLLLFRRLRDGEICAGFDIIKLCRALLGYSQSEAVENFHAETQHHCSLFLEPYLGNHDVCDYGHGDSMHMSNYHGTCISVSVWSTPPAVAPPCPEVSGIVSEPRPSSLFAAFSCFLSLSPCIHKTRSPPTCPHRTTRRMIP
jgi:hypothetical protein